MLEIKEYSNEYIKDAIEIWNGVVAEGVAFPQMDFFNETSGHKFFKEQSFTGLAFSDGKVVGLYILHPNNIGRCGHICNASYAVRVNMRGKGIGRTLVEHCMKKGSELGFKILQFNAVVATNTTALALYKKLGFSQLGIIPNGFLNKDNKYEDIIPHYIELD
ncbi:MAG: GNAT family N-acetyltransferase [Acutalibacteraceae bacterium]